MNTLQQKAFDLILNEYIKLFDLNHAVYKELVDLLEKSSIHAGDNQLIKITVSQNLDKQLEKLREIQEWLKAIKNNK